jgi:hypothetical protein
MPVSAALRRLLRVRTLEEEQQRLALESIHSELHALEHALVLARETERRGRSRLRSSSPASDPADRIAALVESSSGARRAAALRPRIASTEQETARIRQQYFEKRTERRQAETLIREREALDAMEADRRTQHGLDNWFSSQAQRGSSSPKASPNRPRAKEH